MKKFFTLIVTAIVCLTAFAQQEMALSPETMVREATIPGKLPMRAAKKHLAKHEQSANARAAKKLLTKPGLSTNARAAKKAMTAADIVGTYVSYTDVYNSIEDYGYDYCTAVKIVAGEEENTVLITGLQWQNDEYPLKGIVQDDQLIIPGNQTIDEDETDGRLVLGVITDDETGKEECDIYSDEDHPIIFNIYDNSLVLIETQYGVVYVFPDIQDRYDSTYYDLMLLKSNGTMTSEIAVSRSDLSVGETKTGPVYVEITNDSATVYGFDENFVNNIFFYSDGTCIASASKPLYYSYYIKGTYYAFKESIDPTNGYMTLQYNTAPEGTYAGDTIELGMWSMIGQGKDGTYVLRGHKLNSKIVLNEGVLDALDYSALEGTYKVDAKVVREGTSQGEEIFEAKEIKVKQNIKAGYIDVTLPACTSQDFFMAEIVVSDIEVTPSSETPDEYALSAKDYPVVIDGKILTASIFGILNTSTTTIDMTVSASLPDGLGTIEVTYSGSKSKPQTAILFWEDGLTAANEITLSNDIKLAITGNTGKNCTAGNGSITVDGTTYRTLKNSNGAQNTLTAPAGQLIKAVTFYAVGNYTDKGNPVLSEFEGASTSYEVTSLTDYANPTVIPCTLATPAPSVTYTFSKCQVCYIAVVVYDEGTPTAIYTVEEENTPKDRKYIRNGQLIIESNGQKFNAAGMKIGL